MQFNSIEFLFYFLPLFLAVYLIVPGKFRSTILLVGSLGYYAFASGGNYWWVAIFGIITLFSYLAGFTLGKPGRDKLLIAYLGILAAVLIFFKLYNGGRYLPAGMSFYLFQIAAYLIDLHCQLYYHEKNLVNYAAQIAMFPKLLSGPLMDPRKLQLEQRFATVDKDHLRDGMHYLVLGLGLKVLIANRMGGLWNEAAVVGYNFISVPFAWISLIAYSMQLYFDFYGYSMMAIGLGKMLGYDLPRNFDSPYASKSVSEFYRRWHITLGAWFREYLYIPLGGNRKGTWMTIFNLLVVWLFTGLWHGVGGNYILWAGFLFLLIVNERLWLGKLLKKSKVFCHVYLVFVILLSWVPFAVGDWGQMLSFLGRLFNITGSAMNPLDYLNSAAGYEGLMIAGVILATPWPRKLWEKIRKHWIADIFILILFWVVVYFIATAAQDPFMYFQY